MLPIDVFFAPSHFVMGVAVPSAVLAYVYVCCAAASAFSAMAYVTNAVSLAMVARCSAMAAYMDALSMVAYLTAALIAAASVTA
jgi:hypothetical protein